MVITLLLFSRAIFTSCSDWESRVLVASSSSSMPGFFRIALAMATRQHHPSLPHQGVVTIWELRYELVSVGLHGRHLQLVLGDLALVQGTVGDVIPDTGGEEDWFLGHCANISPQEGRVQLSYIHALHHLCVEGGDPTEAYPYIGRVEDKGGKVAHSAGPTQSEDHLRIHRILRRQDLVLL